VTRKARERPIVCGVHDSRSSREAARFAARLSRDLGLALQLAHVVRRRAPGHLTAYSRRASEAKELHRGAGLLRSIAIDLEIAAEHGLHIGDPAKRLVEGAESERAAILVLGSRKGAPPWRGVARSAAANAPCPVILVSDTPDGARPAGSAAF
jgi:nucleotide-binding universal stress UspA family protein